MGWTICQFELLLKPVGRRCFPCTKAVLCSSSNDKIPLWYKRCYGSIFTNLFGSHYCCLQQSRLPFTAHTHTLEIEAASHIGPGCGTFLDTWYGGFLSRMWSFDFRATSWHPGNPAVTHGNGISRFTEMPKHWLSLIQRNSDYIQACGC